MPWGTGSSRDAPNVHVRDHRTCRAEDEPREGEPPVPLGRVREHEQDRPDDGEDVPGEDAEQGEDTGE